jgi:hypothetical protein
MTNKAEETSTHQKALAINLDRHIYGTVAEIGAGQEVARWFFRVGGAAGSIAKTISTYDMKVSDQVYGKADRYVSRDRVMSMLDKEYRLLCERLGETRQSDTRFFAFADTVTAQNYLGTNDCHGWIGLRFQTVPGGEPNDLILHVNMRDRTNIRQQEALGILGINLIYAVFETQEYSSALPDSLFDDLSIGRLEVDLVHSTGPAFAAVKPLEIGLSLVRNEFAQAVLFNPDGELTAPNEIIRKREVIIERGLFKHSTEIKPEVFQAASAQLHNEIPSLEREPLTFMELSVNNMREDAAVEDAEYLRRLKGMTSSGQWTLLTRLKQSYNLTDYLRRYSQKPLRFSMSTSTLAMLFSDEYYKDLPGGLLEATGKIFANNVKIYVHAMPSAAFNEHIKASSIDTGYVTVTGESLVSIHDLEFRGPLDLLYRYVVEAGWIAALPYSGVMSE